MTRLGSAADRLWHDLGNCGRGADIVYEEIAGRETADQPQRCGAGARGEFKPDARHKTAAGRRKIFEHDDL